MTEPRGPLPPIRLRLPDRSIEEEILDGGDVSPTELERSLHAMAVVNRRLGGTKSILASLVAMMRSPSMDGSGTLTLLDVGTGNGAVPRNLARSMRRRGHALDWMGVDLRHPVLVAARRATGSPAMPGAGVPSDRERFLQADGLALPLPDSSVDVVTSSLTLHHLSDSEAPRFLDELARVARRRVLVSDLERHPLHYAGARILSTTLWRKDRVTRIDGPLSVLRSFSRRELVALGDTASLRNVRVTRTFPFRLLLEGIPS